MNAKLVGWVGAILFLIGVVLLFLFFLDFLPLLILMIGLVVFFAIVAVLIVGALILIFAVPYYFVAKKAKVEPGNVTLEDMRAP